MAISKSTNTYNRQNWETSDFPILCQTCLGDNPYLRMMKDTFGDECKICARPFSVFRWCPGARMRYKRTEVCQACAQLKNVCQTCLLDLEYGLPVKLRDHAMNIKDSTPKSDVGREYHLQNMSRELTEHGATEPGGAVGKAGAPSTLLMKLARTTPYYKRNRPHICSFWVKGECKRGEECPYRHEMPTDPHDPLSNQKLKERYYGSEDPVADKLIKMASELPQLTAPEDRTITSLYVGGVEDDITEKDLRSFFYQFGELQGIHMLPRQHCAFVTFNTREQAEKAATGSFNRLVIRGHRLKILWGKAQAGIPSAAQRAAELPPVPGLPRAIPPLPFDPFNLRGDGFPHPQQPQNYPHPPPRAPPPPTPPHPPPPVPLPATSHPPSQHQPYSQLPPPPPHVAVHPHPVTLMPPPGGAYQYPPPPPPPGPPPPPSSYAYPPRGLRPPVGHDYSVHYPSQNPLHLGARPPTIQKAAAAASTSTTSTTSSAEESKDT